MKSNPIPTTTVLFPDGQALECVDLSGVLALATKSPNPEKARAFVKHIRNSIPLSPDDLAKIDLWLARN